MSSNFIFEIDSFKYYASRITKWNPIGEAAFGNDGRPLPYGFGDLSVVLHAVPLLTVWDIHGGAVIVGPGEDYSDSNNLGMIETAPDEGSYKDLYASWKKSLGQFIKVYISSPDSGGTWGNINCRMSYPTILGNSRGEWMVDVQVNFPGAFLPDSAVSGYVGGYVVLGDTGSSTDPPPILGDPPPPAVPGTHYYFGNRIFGKGYFGRGQGG